MMAQILITGGFGYIGTHIASLLSDQKSEFVIYDNFSNCKKTIIDRLNKITSKKVNYVCGDISLRCCETSGFVSKYKRSLDRLHWRHQQTLLADVWRIIL